jgi:hypothetical protein
MDMMEGNGALCDGTANALLRLSLVQGDINDKPPFLATISRALTTQASRQLDPGGCADRADFACLSFYFGGAKYSSFEKWAFFFERQLAGSGRYRRVYDPGQAGVLLAHHSHQMPLAYYRAGEHIVNHIPGADEDSINRKDQQIMALRDSLGDDIASAFVPATFALVDAHECAAFAAELAAHGAHSTLWILKTAVSHGIHSRPPSCARRFLPSRTWRKHATRPVARWWI